MSLSDQDQSQLRALGIDPARAERQLALLRAGQSWPVLVRPCIPGDGILQFPEAQQQRFLAGFESAAAAGRIRRFVPASGAASRMFKPLYAAVEDAADSPLDHYLDSLDRFAFFPELCHALQEAGFEVGELLRGRRVEPLIRYLLEPCGLDYAARPKGMLSFHATGDGPRTPFEEHLAEAAQLLAGLASGVVHFTVSPTHQALFEARFADVQTTLERQYGCPLEVSFSVQKPSTDTLSLDQAGEPLRDAAGELVLRPGGHGALIENLNDLQGDVVQIRNIDNVVPDTRKDANLTCSKLLIGYLLDLQREQHQLLKALHEPDPDPVTCELALAFLTDRLQLDISVTFDARVLIAWLDRPIRVCGMVPNSGEPGGGPFWVRNAEGRVTRQIVEGAQIDSADTTQAAILSRSTHFNPVDIACGVRDWQGRPYDLRQFVDDNAVIVTRKSQDGEEIDVLELPGLWNGAMAGWHTLFVEIPEAAFNPVKTVFDLLRPAHQP